jgi:hypothetical protein
LDNQSI